TANLWALVYLWPFLLIAAGLGLILRSYWKYASVVIDVLVIGGAFLAVLFAPQLGWAHVPDYMFSGDVGMIGVTEKGSGHVVTESRNVQNFTAVEISYPAQVVIRQDDVESLTIEAEDNVIADLRTDVVNGTLEIDASHRRLRVAPTKTVKITIVVKDLARLHFQSAGTVQLEDLKTDDLTILLDGAGTLTLDQIQLQSLNCSLNGAGTIKASGEVNSMTIDLNGMGSFDAPDLHSQTATVKLDGAGSATVWVDKNLDAEIDGVGSVHYYGDPNLTQNIDGLGSINRLGSK
ncbi:MAG: DUF2807 domain-containing protein, partial [Chloroflexi bacterium]|nr:DUF2807 domain-containing protein [Chloroflexota bacterium]